MDRRNFAFDRMNFILLAVGMAIVIIGFLLMITPPSTETHFEESIFSVRAIKVAPTVCLFGFLFVIYGIMAKSKHEAGDNAAHSNDKSMEDNA